MIPLMYLPNFEIMQHCMMEETIYSEEISQLSNNKNLCSVPEFFTPKFPSTYLIYFASNKNECVRNFFGSEDDGRK